MERMHFVASDTDTARLAHGSLVARYGQTPVEEAAVIVALGGDGLMLSTLHRDLGLPVYGMNRGTVGFLMNDYHEDGLPERIAAAEHTVIHPLKMIAEATDGGRHQALAINEVSLLRVGMQAARLRISVNGRVRMEELVCDGALLSTPAGSTAYNYSAHGPIVPLGSNVLALTAIAPFRPRRWRGAILPDTARVRFDILEPEKRPVMAHADSRGVESVVWVEITTFPQMSHVLLHDPGHGLEERLIREQFV
ncbi:NAD kinase [Paracoccus sp. S-4012]|uniref:NAD kinase n=1 Tax=Paracoccus sp. S-4012 TaxID=2665648 RepID=UPI0012B08643|nr:NAD kinase [Paracoccus sp. S-4012]MRX50506.1 NAD kinase [Paracoccus sp. S-4012]